jgi:hypothetical protein
MVQDTDQNQQRGCIIKQRHLSQPYCRVDVSASSIAADDGDSTEREASHEIKCPSIRDMDKVLQ